MDHKLLCPTPPMGWNSWDCFGASVTERLLLDNAEYMALNLRPHGWEYVVCDIQWYEPGAVSTEYRPFVPLEMDEYSRLLPAPNRFPSAAGGQGFRKIADKIHALGLKFGIHIMRGIPRQAVHADTPILGSAYRARSIAQSFSVCSWNTDMYGVNPDAPGAQDYYNSLFALYAEWGVDYVKVDDIANTEYKPHDPYSARREIEMIRRAIDACGRPMVLSLSPGPAPVDHAEHLAAHANLWRITGDFWDHWPALEAMFERCHTWSRHVQPGAWPDCDMLPLGRLAINTPGHDRHARMTNFTPAEQFTLMSLWCIFRSPLMMGGHLPANDRNTRALLTHEGLLRMHRNSRRAHQLQRTADTVIWQADSAEGGAYLAVFNLSNHPSAPSVPLTYALAQTPASILDIQSNQPVTPEGRFLTANLPPHGAAVYWVR